VGETSKVRSATIDHPQITQKTQILQTGHLRYLRYLRMNRVNQSIGSKSTEAFIAELSSPLSAAAAIAVEVAVEIEDAK
jgi:hypothetical protein